MRVEQIPALAVDPEEAPQRARPRLGRPFERAIHGDGFGIALPPEEVLEIAAGVHELVDELALARREARGIERHVDGLPPREALGQVGRRVLDDLPHGGGVRRGWPGGGE